jgi:DNA-binding phage protein
VKIETQHQASIICGARLAARIKFADYNRWQVAGETGMTRHKLQRCINGLASPNVRELRALAKLLRCTADHLLGLDNDATG